MKRTVAFVSLAAALAVAALAQNSSVVKGDDCNDCPIHNCPFCPHSR
jgi:hypothetical protein